MEPPVRPQTDARLQRLRRAPLGQDRPALVALLRERVRAGDLAAARVQLAAGLGDPAACLALGVEHQVDPLRLLDDDDRLVRARAGLACAESALPAYLDETAHTEAADAALAAVAACSQRVHDPGFDLVGFQPLATNDCIPECCWELQDYPAQVLALGIDAVVQSPLLAHHLWFPTIDDLINYCEAHRGNGLQAHAAAALRPLLTTAAQAIRRELVPWLLGVATGSDQAPNA